MTVKKNYYIVIWSKELREGDSKILTNGMEFFCFFWRVLDITCWACYCMVCSSRLSWPLPALTVERCVRFLVDLRVRTKRSPDVPMLSDLPSWRSIGSIVLNDSLISRDSDDCVSLSEHLKWWLSMTKALKTDLCFRRCETVNGGLRDVFRIDSGERSWVV